MRIRFVAMSPSQARLVERPLEHDAARCWRLASRGYAAAPMMSSFPDADETVRVAS
jgi:hypothetical protein